jgi:hypothetical protein
MTLEMALRGISSLRQQADTKWRARISVALCLNLSSFEIQRTGASISVTTKLEARKHNI